MGAKKPSWGITNAWKKTVLYQASWRGDSAIVEVETIKDKQGSFKRVISSIGDFEAPTMLDVKSRVNQSLMQARAMRTVQNQTT